MMVIVCDKIFVESFTFSFPYFDWSQGGDFVHDDAISRQRIEIIKFFEPGNYKGFSHTT
jgi:hypothetical protein